MADDDGLNRSLHAHRPAEVSVREVDEDDMMAVRLPIASTGDVRNEGDDPLSGAELRGMAQQVDSLTRGVFPEHGKSNAVDGGQYSQFEKLGYWSDADIERDAAADDEDLLVATALMPDPETLPAATGDYREALAILKEQALRGIPIAASIAWRDDEDAPGGVDLMEVSVVGIGADPRTSSEGGEQLVARAAVEAGVDPDALVAEVRAIADEVRDGARPLGPPGDRDRFETFEECVSTLSEDDDVSESDAEQMCGAWEQASGAGDPEETHDMTDDDTDTDDATDDEQTQTPDTETALDALREREVSADALVPLLAEVTGADEEAAEAAIEDLQADDEDGDDDEEDEDEEDEEDDDEDQSAADPDEEQSADEADEQQSTDPELAERLDAIEEGLDAIREGEFDLDTPDPDEEQSADEAADEDEPDATTDPAAPPEWATTE